MPLILIIFLLVFSPAHAAGVGVGQICLSDSGVKSHNVFANDYFHQVSNCQQRVRSQIYQTVGYLAQGNKGAAQNMLAMTQVENGCVGAQPSRARCDGTYSVSNPSGARGAAQIMPGTFPGLIKDNRAQIIRDLGGCSSGSQYGASGSLTDPNRVKDGRILGQFIDFRNFMCSSQSNSISDQERIRYSDMVGVSVYLSKIHNKDASQFESLISGVAQSSNMNAGAISNYALHNLGGCMGPRFLRTLASNPNASVSSVFSHCPPRGRSGSGWANAVIDQNSGLYCSTALRRGQRCPQELTVSQAAARMNDKMFSPSSTCVSQGLAALGMGAPDGSLVGDGIIPDATNSIVAISGDLAALEMSAGGALNDGSKKSDWCSSSVGGECPPSMRPEATPQTNE